MGTLGDEGTAAVVALETEVDDVIGCLDDAEVMFDDDEGIAGFGEAVEDVYELFGIGDVEASGRLVEHVDGAAGGLARARWRA